MVDQWFSEIAVKRIRRGTFKNVAALIPAIRAQYGQLQPNPSVFCMERIGGMYSYQSHQI